LNVAVAAGPNETTESGLNETTEAGLNETKVERGGRG
jgi:hypothetical protein